MLFLFSRFSCALLLLSRRSVCWKRASSSSSCFLVETFSPSFLEEEVEVEVVVFVVVPDDFSFLEKLTSRGLKLCISGHGLLCCCCCCLQWFFSFLGRVGCFLLVFCFVFFWGGGGSSLL